MICPKMDTAEPWQFLWEDWYWDSKEEDRSDKLCLLMVEMGDYADF